MMMMAIQLDDQNNSVSIILFYVFAGAVIMLIPSLPIEIEQSSIFPKYKGLLSRLGKQRPRGRRTRQRQMCIVS